MRQFVLMLGVVENIDTTSRHLKEALESGKTIIATTLQKFPFITQEIGALSGKRFAVIIDEAHSPQSGEQTKSLKEVLKARPLAEAEAEEAAEETPKLPRRRASLPKCKSADHSAMSRSSPSRRRPKTRRLNSSVSVVRTANFEPGGTQDRLYAALGPVLERFRNLTPEEQPDFRK